MWKFILSNVRQPDHMAGDLHAQMASGEVGAQRLEHVVRAHGLDDIESWPTRSSTVPKRPPGTAFASCRAGPTNRSAVLDLADGSKIDIVVRSRSIAMLGEITVDYDGTSEASPWGINVVMNYTHAYTTFHGAIGA